MYLGSKQQLWSPVPQRHNHWRVRLQWRSVFSGESKISNLKENRGSAMFPALTRPLARSAKGCAATLAAARLPAFRRPHRTRLLLMGLPWLFPPKGKNIFPFLRPSPCYWSPRQKAHMAGGKPKLNNKNQRWLQLCKQEKNSKSIYPAKGKGLTPVTAVRCK